MRDYTDDALELVASFRRGLTTDGVLRVRQGLVDQYSAEIAEDPRSWTILVARLAHMLADLSREASDEEFADWAEMWREFAWDEDASEPRTPPPGMKRLS